MINDLREILEGWDYEPGRISVRKILGADGREKLQTRVDLGVIQLETTARPDGRKFRGRDSLLDLHGERLAQHNCAQGSDEDFALSPDECRELRHEAYLYHQRFVSLFVLEEFEGVIRDTEHCLRLIAFCGRYAAQPADREALEQYRNYVYMMNTRSRALQAAELERFDEALRLTDEGIAELGGSTDDSEPPELEDWHRGEPVGEVELLQLLKQQILERMPKDSAARLDIELKRALGNEDYEEAARIRDRMNRARRASS